MNSLDIKKIKGQKYIVDSILTLYKTNSLPKLLVFSGEPGTGKTSLSRCIMGLYSCKFQNNYSACGVCPDCLKILDSIHESCIELDISRYNMEEIDALIESIKYMPLNSDRKIYIMDECHNIPPKGWSALLKTFEDPESINHFILITNYIEAIPANILNRSIRYNFNKVEDKYVTQLITENIIDNNLTKPICWASEGSMRVANNLVKIANHLPNELKADFIEKNCGYSEWIESVNLRQIYQNPTKEFFKELDEYLDKIVNYTPFLHNSQKVLYDLMLENTNDVRYSKLILDMQDLLDQKHITKFCIVSIMVRAYGSIYFKNLKNLVLYYLIKNNSNYINRFIQAYNNIEIAAENNHHVIKCDDLELSEALKDILQNISYEN